MFGQRASGGQILAGQQEDRATVDKLAKKPLEYLKMFYADTTGQSPIAINAALRFFGHDQVLMGTDFPWTYPVPHMQALEQVTLTEAQREQLLSGNAQRVLGVH